MATSKETSEKSSNPVQLDPKSEKYRVCPNDGVKFMTNHLSRQFCCDKCADEFHNRKKRDEKKNAEKRIVVETKEALTAPIPLPIEKQSKPNAKEINIEILLNLLGDEDELEIHIDELLRWGFSFSDFDTLENLPHCNLKKANYGNYSIVWSSNENVLLTHQKNLLWTSIS